MASDPAAEALQNNYRKVTDNRYDISDYESTDETSRGHAETHEQMSDAYFAGTSDGVVQRAEGEVHLTDENFDEDNQE
ncbi:YozQ family protein [Paenibacillus hamazuiensis]|uniref:YozQ family protein n=1 Tax=Paenibacillus hamazuiensis TaxID=2936508 RepID=UPI00201080C1|nr:YozQ family protein [Paenibacillus hamazuiensis]